MTFDVLRHNQYSRYFVRHPDNVQKYCCIEEIMEKNKKIAFCMTIFVTVVFSLIPLFQKLSCSEPEPTFMMAILQKSGLITTGPVCQTVLGTLMGIMNGLCTVVVGGLVGFMYGCGHMIEEEEDGFLTEEERVRYSRYARCIQEAMREVEFPEDYLHESLIRKRSIF